MGRIVGIDLSLTGTGLAQQFHQLGEWYTESTVITSSGKKDDGLEQRFDRQSAISTGVLEYVLTEDHPDLVVIESLFNSGQVGGSLIDRAGLWWRIVGSLLAYDIPVVTASPAQGKKFLTGAGNADKGAMAMYASKIHPQWTPSTSKNANDEADAVALADIGTCLMVGVEDWPVPETDYRHKIVDDINTKQKLREPA